MQTYTDNCFTTTGVVQTQMGQVEENFAALKSAFSGATTPANTVAGMWWFDTTANILKLRNEANSAWLSVWDFANNKPIVTNNISADFGAALKDPAAGTAGLRTLGTTAVKAAAGNDSRFSTIPDDYVTTIKILNGNVTAVKLQVYTAGDYLEASDSGATNNNTYTKVAEIYLPRSGTIRTVLSLSNPSGIGHGRIYRNGAAVGTDQSHSPYTWTQDISGWSAGDLCQLYVYNTGGYSTSGTLQIYTGTPILATTIM